MPITAKFLADFSDFYDGVQQAEVSLKGFEQSAAKVGTSLDRMAESFSGRKVIQDATLMMAAVEKIGGAAQLTDAEFARLVLTVDEAAKKMTALGIAVPADMAALVKNVGTLNTNVSTLTGSLGGAAGAIGKFGTSLGTVDRALAVFGGVRLGGTVAALGELSGVLATAGAALSTFNVIALGIIVGGAIGKMITAWPEVKAGIVSVGDAITEQAARWLGFGATIDQAAIAKMNTLANASGVAKRAITDLKEAEDILNTETERMADVDKKAAEKKKELAAESNRLREEAFRLLDESVERSNAAFKKRQEDAAQAAADAAKASQLLVDAEVAYEMAAWKKVSDYQNMIGEFQMQNEKARLDFEAAEHKKAVDAWIEEEARKYTANLLIVGAGPKAGQKGLKGNAFFNAPDVSSIPVVGQSNTVTVNIDQVNGSGDQVLDDILKRLEQRMKESRRFPSA